MFPFEQCFLLMCCAFESRRSFPLGQIPFSRRSSPIFSGALGSGIPTSLSASFVSGDLTFSHRVSSLYCGLHCISASMSFLLFELFLALCNSGPIHPVTLGPPFFPFPTTNLQRSFFSSLDLRITTASSPRGKASAFSLI